MDQREDWMKGLGFDGLNYQKDENGKRIVSLEEKVKEQGIHSMNLSSSQELKDNEKVKSQEND